MGHPDKLTPDIVEWLLSDEAVVNSWKSLARRLGLEAYVVGIDKNYSYKRKKFERAKLKELLEVWQRASPITYTRSRLMDVLSKEGLNDMYMWLQLMATEKSKRKEQIDYMLHSPRPPTVRLSLQNPNNLSKADSSCSPSSSSVPTPRQKCLRFADDLEIYTTSSSSRPAGPSSSRPRTAPEPPKRCRSPDLDYVVRSPRRGTDNSVERYFDNLITMIEDAAEGL